MNTIQHYAALIATVTSSNSTALDVIFSVEYTE